MNTAPLAPSYRYKATVVSIHDGDTIHAQVDLGFFTSMLLSVRLLGINAPELSTADGPASRDYLAGLIPPSTALVIDTVKVDKYGGRWDAQIYRASDGFDVCADMIASGHAVAY